MKKPDIKTTIEINELEYFTTKEAAEFLKMNNSALFYHIKENRFKTYQLGKMILLEKESVLEFQKALNIFK